MMQCLLLFVTVFISMIVGSTKHISSLCEQQSPSSLSAKQRISLCTHHLDSNVTFPAQCAQRLFESRLGWSVDEVISFCSFSNSLIPSRCLIEMNDMKLRKDFGTRLCLDAESQLVALCFNNLTSHRKGHKIGYDSIIDFCRSPKLSPLCLSCIRISLETQVISIENSLDNCCETTGDYFIDSDITSKQEMFMEECFSYFKGKRHLASDIVKFCLSTKYSSNIDCLESTSSIKPSLSSSCQLQLCHESFDDSIVESQSPSVSCFLKLRASKSRLSNDDAIRLCHAVKSSLPATCFLHSFKIVANSSSRISLCRHLAEVEDTDDVINSFGPVNCFRDARRYFPDDHQTLTLCGLHSDANTAKCFASAPSFLSQQEKVVCCKERHDEVTSCLQNTNAAMQLYEDRPKVDIRFSHQHAAKFQAVRWHRQKLIEVCAGRYSNRVVHCLQVSYKLAIPLGEALETCQNLADISQEASSLQFYPLCYQQMNSLLSSSRDRAMLAKTCSHATSVVHVNKISKCVLSLSLPLVIALGACEFEDVEGKVLSCIQQSRDVPIAASICPHNSLAASCINDLRDAMGWSLIKFANETEGFTLACGRSTNHKSLVKCLARSGVSVLSSVHVEKCLVDTIEASTSLPSKVKLVKLEPLRDVDDEYPYLRSSKPFSLTLQLLDEWGEPWMGFNTRFSISLTRSTRNSLFGVSSNTSLSSLLHFSQLMVSNSGNVSFKLLLGEEVIDKFIVVIQEHRNVRDLELDVSCQSLLTSSLRCESEDDAIDFPWMRSFIPFEFLFKSISCEDLFHQWAIDSFIDVYGTTILIYRFGIQLIQSIDRSSVPSIEMSYLERLELSNSWLHLESKFMSKQLKKAYYRQTLLWHPDRWTGPRLRQYQVIASGVFHLIAEAYKELSDKMKLSTE